MVKFVLVTFFIFGGQSTHDDYLYPDRYFDSASDCINAVDILYTTDPYHGNLVMHYYCEEREYF